MNTREDLARHYQAVAAHLHWEMTGCMLEAKRMAPYPFVYGWDIHRNHRRANEFAEMAARASATARLLMGVEDQ